MSTETIYKKTANGLTQVWRMEISEDGESYRTVSGKEYGVMVYSTWKKPTMKNVGKTNETSIKEQVLLEVESKYKKKLAQGNYNDIFNVGKDNYFKPMLAKTYGKDFTPSIKDYEDGKVVSQPKLDGVRCVINKAGMWSREGKPIVSCPHVYDSFKEIFEEYPDMVLDGELYTHRLRDDFNAIISMVKKSKPTPDDLIESEKHVQFWVYDINSEEEFKIRFEWLEELVPFLGKYVVLVDTVQCDNSVELDDLYASYTECGYEGQMVRISSKGYENKRSKQLNKRKEFVDEEFIIHDVLEGVGNRSGMAGRLEYKLADGRVAGSGIRGNFAFFTDLYLNKDLWVDTLVTIRYQNLTPDGIPRFAVATKFWGTKRREI